MMLFMMASAVGFVFATICISASPRLDAAVLGGLKKPLDDPGKC